jgi:hypothetical protein
MIPGTIWVGLDKRLKPITLGSDVGENLSKAPREARLDFLRKLFKDEPKLDTLQCYLVVEPTKQLNYLEATRACLEKDGTFTLQRLSSLPTHGKNSLTNCEWTIDQLVCGC